MPRILLQYEHLMSIYTIIRIYMGAVYLWYTTPFFTI